MHPDPYTHPYTRPAMEADCEMVAISLLTTKESVFCYHYFYRYEVRLILFSLLLLPHVVAATAIVCIRVHFDSYFVCP